jgi:hypothetical protein
MIRALRFLSFDFGISTNCAHIDLSISPFFWQFAFSRSRLAGGREGFASLGPITLDWSWTRP